MSATSTATTTRTAAPVSIRWDGDHNGHLVLLDQTRLPTELKWIDCQTTESVWEAIKMLRVRGAPAIGIAAAYGVVVSAIAAQTLPIDQQLSVVESAIDYLATSRPTAVNLFWALDRIRKTVESQEFESSDQLCKSLLVAAIEIHDEDRRMCRAIGRHAATLLSDGNGVLTHCNAGGLATSEYGTAISGIFTAHDQGKKLHVWVDETRPLLQGARLTAWELMQHGVDCTLICDSMAAQVMREKRVDAVIVGSDRITAGGDAANKIGTYSVAVLAKHHNIPFYVAAPSSTFDLSIVSGDEIPIEQRADEEITNGFGRQTAPDDVKTYNPAFDVTPADLIAAIITERGIIHEPDESKVRAHLA
jgi:methylthioribose-1-phosphate isomerase